MSISLQMWTYPILISLFCVCVAKRYLQQKSRLHYQGDMGLFLILVFFFFFVYVFVFLFCFNTSLLLQ